MVVETERTNTTKCAAARFRRGDPVGWERLLWAARTLRDQSMPPMEIHTVLVTEDPEIIRRHLDLHRERLEERLMDELALIARIEMLLIEAVRRTGRRDGTGPATRGDAGPSPFDGA